MPDRFYCQGYSIKIGLLSLEIGLLPLDTYCYVCKTKITTSGWVHTVHIISETDFVKPSYICSDVCLDMFSVEQGIVLKPLFYEPYTNESV